MGYQWRGMYLEDVNTEDVFCTSSRTVTEADVSLFAGLTGDYNPLHTDEVWAKENIFGTRIAHGMLAASIMAGQINQLGLFEGTTLAFMENQLKFTAPCRIGATVHTEVVCAEANPSKKPGRGIVKYRARLIDEEGRVLVEALHVLLVKSKNKNKLVY